jgi:hypothetical protein
MKTLMKNFKVRILGLFLIGILTVALLISSCQKMDNPFDGVNLITNADLITTSYSIQFVDAKTGIPIGNKDSKVVSVKISGKDKGSVIDISGTSLSTYKSASGFLGLALTPGIAPTPASLVKFTIVATCAGFVSTSYPVTSVSSEHQAIVIKMVNIDAPPAGIVSKTITAGTISGGENTTQIIISTSTTGPAATKANLVIPAGTTIYSDNNVKFSNGPITVSMVYFSTADEALEAFPGGLMASVNNKGNMENGLFSSAGFVSIEIKDSKGHMAKQFSTPIQLKVEVDPATLLEGDGRQIMEGDSIPVWSYEPETGEWKYETTSVISKNTSGNFEVNTSLPHLSYWNLDWFSGNYCYQGVKFIINQIGGNAGSISGKLVIKRQSNKSYMYSHTVWIEFNKPNQLLFAPAGIPVIVELYDRCGKLIGSINVPNLCGNQTYTINVNTTAGTNVNVSVLGKCPNKPTVSVKPSLGIWYYDLSGCSGGYWSYAFMSNGKLVLPNMVLGHNYIFGAYYDGMWAFETFNVSKSNYDFKFTLTQSMCKKF